MARSPSRLSPVNPCDVIKDRFEVKHSLGEGGFGAVFEVWDRKEKQKCAIKVELARPADNEPGLELEIGVLKKLQASPHVARFKDEGRCGPLRYVIMQLVGCNLSDLRGLCPQSRFTAKTTVRLAIQCLEAIQDVHKIGFVHRDIKPSNFAMGRDEVDSQTVYILDFGLVRYCLTGSGELRPERSRVGFRGTVRYASVNTHKHKDLGRHDDLWSWLYMVIEMYRGELPWRNENDRDKVGLIKDGLSRNQLLGDIGSEFALIYEHLKSLTYQKKPDYDFLHKSLLRAAKRFGLKDSDPFDWEPGGVAHSKSHSVATQPYNTQMPERDNVVNIKLPDENPDSSDH